MSNNVANKQEICNVLKEAAAKDRDIIVLCSDSRGSGSMGSFFDEYPKQSVEMGIAEQDLVSVSAGLASCGKKPFAISPSSFLSSRSLEQIKIDVAYSSVNVKLVGISGGVSYGALGASHHSVQDIASVVAIPNIRMYIPSDRFLTRILFEHLVTDEKAAYIRVGRNASEDVYDSNMAGFSMDKAITLRDGSDATIIACGDMVYEAKLAAEALAKRSINCRVIDMYCIKPIDKAAVIDAAKTTGGIVTVEEHSILGGLGAMVSQITAAEHPVRVKNLALPDETLICGKQREVFDHYGLNARGIEKAVTELLCG